MFGVLQKAQSAFQWFIYSMAKIVMMPLVVPEHSRCVICILGFTNGTTGMPISFRILPMMVLPLAIWYQCYRPLVANNADNKQKIRVSK